MKNFLLKFGGMFASLALVVTTVVANSTCVCIMHAMKIKKRIFAFAVACAMTLPNIVQLTAVADEGEKYQYTMFGRNGITMNAGNLCMNGSMHTNKEAVITASNKNINGTVTTGSDIEKRVKHVYADQKIHDTYFTENCDLYEEEYVYSDINIHINNSLYCQDNISLDGNVSLNSSMGSLMDIHVTGEVKNANNSIVYSKYGNITIENDSTANINGLVYAPLGTLTINSPNINLNGVIIADQIVINGSSVNINGNDNIARFIGTTSEIYDFSGLEYLPEEWLGDSDADDLFDIYEKVIDSDPFNPHTDSDELPDGYEVLTLNTDPLEVDTDENGVWDCDEDFDCDNLSNLGEYQNQTDPFISDTDEDGLLDGDEIYIYGTIPTNPDTDGDSLLDGEEGYDGTLYANYGIYFDPLNPDTDGDGIWDGDEVFGQTKEQVVETHDEAITEVTVDMDTNGSLERNLSIESMYEIDAMSTNVYALVGEPFNFESATGFESATITFKIDQSKLGDALFDNLIILWYNEEEQKFEEMPTTRDAANSTVSTTTTHFSQYMVVDSVKWYENWEESLSKLRDMWDDGSYYQRNMHTIFMVDCSSSMSSSDPCETIPVIGYKGVTAENIDDIKADINGDDDVKSYCVNWSTRARVCYNIINNKASGDLGTVITFSGGIINDSGFSYRKAYLNSYLPEIRNVGGTANFNSALSLAQSYVDPNSTDLYRFIVITNNDLSYYNITPDMFADNVIFNIVNIGPGYMDSGITSIAQATGGDVYNTVTGGQLINQSGGYIYTPPQYIGTDFDEDGIPDLVELYGLLPNGQPLGTNPEKKDSDGDEIDDNVEFNYVHSFLTPDVTLSEYINAIKANSFPGKSDSDGDDLLDSIDKYTMWNDPDPLSASNIQSVQFINVPSADPVQPDFILSIVKSKKIPDDIFFAYADNVTNIGGFAVTSELKSQLLDLEECYNKNGKWSSTNNEVAAHAAKLETDQLVPEYFEYGSNAYYGCWAYNYQAELNAFDYWSNIIDTATQAYTVYITIAGLYQAKLASIEQRTITLSNTEYASTANNVSISGSAAIPDLSNKAVKHPMNDHMPARYAKQLSYIDRASAEKYLDYKSFFNKNWTDEQVRSALNYGYKDALSKGFTSGKYTFTYLGDEVTIYMENGIFKTGYGNYKFTYEELLELLS